MSWLKSLFAPKKIEPVIAAASAEDRQFEDAFIKKMNELLDSSQKSAKRTLETLPGGQRAVYATYVLESEVLNGGFNQFFFNSSGELADMALEGFRLLGHEGYTDIVARAVQTYAAIKPELKKKNDGSVEAFADTYKDNPLNDLSLAFTRLVRTDSLTTLRAKFMREHPADFQTQ